MTSWAEHPGTPAARAARSKPAVATIRGGGALSGRSVLVSSLDPDGSPKTVRLSGTCGGNLPACSFSVAVEDHGEPGRSDQFGITVTGGLFEARSQRVISNGNIQFHR
jgi:hypothetical protein